MTESAPLFIIGHPKSGTTLIKNLLDGHPQLFVSPEETDYYSRVAPCIKDGLSAGEFIKVLRKHSHYRRYYELSGDDISGNFDYSGFRPDLFEAYFRENSKYNLEDVVKACGAGFSANLDKGVKYWVEKTPSHSYFVKEILRDYPKAKFVVIVRNPYNNYVSYKKKHPGLKINVFCRNWIRVLENMQLIESSDACIIKYEDLISKPDMHMKEVANFLGIDYCESMLSPTRGGSSWEGNSMHGIRSNKVYKNTHSSGADKSTKDMDIIYSLCKAEIKKFGYQNEYRHVGLFKDFFYRVTGGKV